MVGIAVDETEMRDSAFEIVCTTEDRPAWLEARSQGIGSSDAAALVGESTRSSPVELWGERTGRRPPPDLDGLEYVQWGTWHEAGVAAAYSLERYSGRDVARTIAGLRRVQLSTFEAIATRMLRAPQQLLRSKLHPWASATIDGWTLRPSTGCIPLELKNSAGWFEDDWAHGPPMMVWWQVQHQMLVTGASFVSVACLLGGNHLVWCDVERDEVAIRRLTIAGTKLMACIASDTPPEHVPSLASVHILFPPKGNLEDGIVPIRAVDLDKDLVAVKLELKAAEAQKDALTAAIANAIGHHGYGELETGVVYSYRTQTREGYVARPSTSRVLRRHKKLPRRAKK